MADVALYTYLDDWNDEIIPCLPTLQGWADWLAAPDPDWNRTAPEDSGTEYAASTLRVLSNLTVVRTADGLSLGGEVPAETTQVFVRHGGPETGWDPDLSVCAPWSSGGVRSEIQTLMNSMLSEGDEACLACCASAPRALVRFEITPDGPRCIFVGGNV